MNIINRFLAVIFVFILSVGGLALAVAPFAVLSWLQDGLARFGQTLTAQQNLNPTLFIIARLLVVVIAVLVFVAFLLAEWPRRAQPAVRLQTSAGAAEVTTDSVARRLRWHLDQLADVLSVEPTVRPHGDRVDVFLDVETSPAIEVPMKTEEVMLVAREVVEERMGLKLGRLEVRIRHSEFPKN
ncbi:MAG: alkaline shock response membrane anchor protein AmaP [Caldilineales bacterium]|nr:alkaline shock response membrane anchor protein AmaP [Caldilineales bacterium]